MTGAEPRTASDRATEPQVVIRQALRGFWLSRAIWLAARLRLADAIGAGPASADEVARAAGADTDAVERLLRALAAAGVFDCDGDGRYRPTPVSDLLRSDHPRSQRGLVEVVVGGEHFEAWGAVETSLRTGQPGFEARHGMSWIDYYSAHPEAAGAFAEAMSGTTRAYEEAILESDPFPEFALAVDVGGSRGSLLRSLLERRPESQGIVFDLPDVIDGWPPGAAGGLGSRLTGVGGDFFEAVPGGGDLYLLKLILHDWDDERAETILRRVREAARPGGRVAIVETVLPEAPVDHPGWLMDLNMLAVTGGRERTAAEFATLLERSGWGLERVVPTSAPISVVLASAR